MQTVYSLKQLSGLVINNIVPQATSHKSFFINDIDPAITVQADTALLVPALKDILLKALAHSENHCIRLSASFFGNIIAVCIKTGLQQCSTIAINMEALQPLAEQLGGSITVMSDHRNNTLVAFSFYNGLRAA
ncbi:MAG TPA: hypothetical protein VF487_03405 [Chitinophagaceae bacterium]